MTVARVPGNLQGTILLFLSLNLILLVFFTLLNVMASPSATKNPEKEMAFSAAPKRGNGGDMDVPPAVWQGWLQSSLVQAVNGRMVISPEELMADADSLWVTLPAASFFEGRGTAVKAEQVGVLENISALAGQPEQNALRLEIGLKAPKGDLPLAAARVAEMGRIVFAKAKGKPADTVTVAAQPLKPADGDAPLVVFTFRAKGHSANVERAEGKLNSIGGKTEWLQERGGR